MKISLAIPLVLTLSVSGVRALADNSELERLSGFAQHHKKNEKFDEARERGESAQAEEDEQWELRRDRDLLSYRKEKHFDMANENSPEARVDDREKREYEAWQAEEQRKFLRERGRQESVVVRDGSLPSEAQELGIDLDRPRYDYRKRADFGATNKLGKNGPRGSSSGSSSGGGRFSNPSPSFPPPPSFDGYEGGDDEPYIPAPTMSNDGFGDFPPPPPPPPPYIDDGNNINNNFDFPPPPPPEEGMGDF